MKANKDKVVVLFEVTPTAEGKRRYLELAARLKPLLANAEGFIRAERFGSLNVEGKLLSMSVWESEEAVESGATNFPIVQARRRGAKGSSSVTG